jgi:hypothetical protein
MLRFTINKRPRGARATSADRRLNLGLDRRPMVKKSGFQFADVFRSADGEAERQTMTPHPRTGFREFFARWAQPRQVPIVAPRMDPSFPSASGARLTLLL